ncbi:MAG: hypothetical protein CMK70_14225 [Pseudohongiella sp.]|nr:hypothetical protein [Pseudohongiella sp.]|tara:strand:+ start:22824 stop:24146 length:1323 start_codon:yes stop_codon:yes gene_type:complete
MSTKIDNVGYPKLSVVIATYNAGDTLRPTLESLLAQTYNNFEIILVDGGSVDETVDFAKKYSANISTIISEPDEGIADAWNKALAYVNGDWVTFLNSGDLLHRDHFLRVSEVTGNYEYSRPTILFCDVLKFNNKNQPTTVISGRPPKLSKIKLGSVGFSHPGSFSALSCFRDVGLFDKNLKIAIDSEWILRCFTAGHHFAKFQSIAYMAEGGVSDRYFYKAIREYYDATLRLDLTTIFESRVRSIILPVLRSILHLYRRTFKQLLRTLKHILIRLANLFAQLLPFYSMRNLYFRLLGFKLAASATISMGFQFYVPGRIELGAGSVVNRDCLFDNRSNIVIGKNVSIARNVKIFTAGHDIESPFFEMISSPVYIDDHSVLFAGVTVMPGVRIGRGAVVLGCSVVTKDVQPMSIVGGVPARFISDRHTTPRYNLSYPFPLAM